MFIKQVVNRQGIDNIRAQLGVDVHLEIISSPGIPVDGLCEDVFFEHLDHDLAGYVLSIGIALLAKTVAPLGDFALQRMRFSFSPTAWETRATDIHVDLNYVSEFIQKRLNNH